MRMIKTLALSLVLAATTAPAWAQATTDTDRQLRTQADLEAYETQVPALTYTIEQNRLAAAAYMQDALRLLDRAEAQLRAGQQASAVSMLLGASGKLTYAYLELHQDREFSQRIQPLAMSADRAVSVAQRDPQEALALVSAMVPEVASLYQVQVAQLGGGAGAGLEGFEELQQPEMGQDQQLNPDMQPVHPLNQEPLHEQPNQPTDQRNRQHMQR